MILCPNFSAYEVLDTKTSTTHDCEGHRRTGNFLPGGAVNYLPKKIPPSCPNFYETVEKKRGPYDATTWAVLAYEGGSIL